MTWRKGSGFALQVSFVLLFAAPLFVAPRLVAQSLAPTPTHLVTPGMAAPSSAAQENPAAASAANPAAPGALLTLDQLEQLAVANNPTLGEAKANVDAAAGRTRQAGLWPNPAIGYTGEEIRGGSYGGGQQGAFVEQRIVLGGKLGLDRKASGEEGQQAQEQARAQQLRVQNTVRIAFYELLAAQQMVDLRAKLSQLARDAVETTRQLQNVGQADQPDLLEAQVESDEADLAVTAAEHQQQSAWRMLAAIVGRPDLPPARLAGNLEDFPQLDPNQILQTILRDSPAVKIAQLDAERAETALTRAHRETVPDLRVRAGYLDNLEQLEPGSPVAVGSEAFAEVGIDLPLFNRNEGNIGAARAERERATLEVQRVSLALQQAAAPALQEYASARAVAERYKKQTLPEATRAYALYLQRYREGAAAYPQVLIAQRTVFQLQASYLSALESVWVNAAALQGLLLVGGLDAPPSRAVDPVRPEAGINMPYGGAPGAR
ncbi:MAG TPA: TolC family protein [Candidatus Acidoferrales bacterium]|jgi:cobalt-zinc-cadmium efflux system outer membrane protein|nr:TolC family protein [Candidatus Acidoferrales bacterium]